MSRNALLIVVSTLITTGIVFGLMYIAGEPVLWSEEVFVASLFISFFIAIVLVFVATVIIDRVSDSRTILLADVVEDDRPN